MRTLESPDDNGLFNIPPHQRYNVACISLCYGTAHVHRGPACTTHASPLICPLVLRCCWRAHRPLSVCACCAAARVRTAPHLSARAAMLLACTPRPICLRVLRCCWRAHRPLSVCACCAAARVLLWLWCCSVCFPFPRGPEVSLHVSCFDLHTLN